MIVFFVRDLKRMAMPYDTKFRFTPLPKQKLSPIGSKNMYVPTVCEHVCLLLCCMYKFYLPKYSEPRTLNILIRAYFEIIVDSLAVVRNNTERSQVPITQGPLMVTFHKTTVHYHN